MENTLTVEFRLIGRGFVPKELSRELGKECTKYELGDVNFWILSKTRTGNIDIKALCHEFISELQPMQEKLCWVIEKFDLRPDFCLLLNERPRTSHEVLYGEHPVINFCIEPATMRFLSAINAPIFIEREYESEEGDSRGRC
jgi:hypothetical protein